jgi:hypothetical protein
MTATKKSTATTELRAGRLPNLVEKPQIFPATYKKQVFCILEMRLNKGGPPKVRLRSEDAADIVTSSPNISPAVSHDSKFSYY